MMGKMVRIMKLNPIISPLLHNTRHGFFTRIGGVSTGIYAGLNCGLGSGDSPESTTQNRTRVADYLNVTPAHLCGVYQIHSNTAVEISAPTAGVIKADALVTNRTGLALGVLTADCAPILFYAPSGGTSGVIAAAHAGWKGALFGVIENTVALMERLGAVRGEISAVVGPCISAANYQVGLDFYDNFTTQNTDYSQFFTRDGAEHYRFDLPAFCLFQLAKAGVKFTDWTGDCTYEQSEKFYSYRRATHQKEADYGRQISAISLNNK